MDETDPRRLRRLTTVAACVALVAGILLLLHQLGRPPVGAPGVPVVDDLPIMPGSPDEVFFEQPECWVSPGPGETDRAPWLVPPPGFVLRVRPRARDGRVVNVITSRCVVESVCDDQGRPLSPRAGATAATAATAPGAGLPRTLELRPHEGDYLMYFMGGGEPAAGASTMHIVARFTFLVARGRRWLAAPLLTFEQHPRVTVRRIDNAWHLVVRSRDGGSHPFQPWPGGTPPPGELPDDIAASCQPGVYWQVAVNWHRRSAVCLELRFLDETGRDWPAEAMHGGSHITSPEEGGAETTIVDIKGDLRRGRFVIGLPQELHEVSLVATLSCPLGTPPTRFF